MSHSKKHFGCIKQRSHDVKFYKRKSCRSVRKFDEYESIPVGSFYKKLYCSWMIHDYKSIYKRSRNYPWYIRLYKEDLEEYKKWVRQFFKK